MDPVRSGGGHLRERRDPPKQPHRIRCTGRYRCANEAVVSGRGRAGRGNCESRRPAMGRVFSIMKKWLKRIGLAMLIAALLIGALVAYAYFVEPRQFVVVNETLSVPNWSPQLN